MQLVDALASPSTTVAPPKKSAPATRTKPLIIGQLAETVKALNGELRCMTDQNGEPSTFLPLTDRRLTANAAHLIIRLGLEG